MQMVILGGIIATLIFVLIFLAAIVLVTEFVDIGWVNKRRKNRSDKWPLHICPKCNHAWHQPIKEENDE